MEGAPRGGGRGRRQQGLAAESDLVRFVGVDDLVSSQHRRPGRVRVQQQFGRP
ncbi:hypothetical protein ABZY09_27985 [Streptomyces sp. NPDC002928]|uniref:hypothetical protein n=1 Tax=Streptomyces sp. NPDC002928 TaxID=3154440 RepID=UPI0033B19499